MKTEKNILVAFILNLGFSIFEFVGGTITGSVAIVSDAIHDIGDALSIGISLFLERKSRKKPDEKYTYGYMRYSVLGGLVTTSILLVGSILVILGAIERIQNPVEIHYDRMILFAVIGTIINFLAAYFTRDGDSINQKSVNLHMLEDVLGWVVVLVGAFIMKFTDISLIDAIMSIGVSFFIFLHAFKNLKEIANLFLEKTPEGISILELREHILEVEEVEDVHHIHVWSIDGVNNYATMHVVTAKPSFKIKSLIREELREHGIAHATIEFESPKEHCEEIECHVEENVKTSTHHHHH